MSCIKNFAYTIPTEGRIAIGQKVTTEKGKSLPQKLNHFVITAQHKRDGEWAPHPAAEDLAKKFGGDAKKITEIPVKVIANDVDLILRERYEAFDNTGRMLCAGDGEKARRRNLGKIDEVACAGPDHCEFAKAARCKLMSRLNVQIDLDDEAKSWTADPMSTFILRSAGFNTARTLRSKLTGLRAMLGGKLVGVPLMLKLRQKSSAISHQSIFYYVDIVPRVSLPEAAKIAKEAAEHAAEIGLDQDSFEAIMKANLENGPFEDTTEDFAEASEYVDLDDLPEEPAVTQQGADEAPPLMMQPLSGGSRDKPMIALANLRALVSNQAPAGGGPEDQGEKVALEPEEAGSPA